MRSPHRDERTLALIDELRARGAETPLTRPRLCYIPHTRSLRDSPVNPVTTKASVASPSRSCVVSRSRHQCATPKDRHFAVGLLVV